MGYLLFVFWFSLEVVDVYGVFVVVSGEVFCWCEGVFGCVFLVVVVIVWVYVGDGVGLFREIFVIWVGGLVFGSIFGDVVFGEFVCEVVYVIW